MNQSIYIPRKYTTLNEYIKSERTIISRKGKKVITLGSQIKKNETEWTNWYVKKKLKVIEKKVLISFTWYCQNKRVDPDNVCFSKKFILDGLVDAEILKNDGANNIQGFEDSFVYGNPDRNYGVMLDFIEVDV